MEVIVCYDGDKIGRRVGRAVLNNDVGEVRRVDQAINAGNELWRNFAVNVGGSVIEVGGDEGRIMVDASRLSEVPGVAQRYSETVGATVSVGIGMKLSEAAQALVIAKLRGGNRIVVWDDDMKAEYQSAVDEPKTEAEKIHDEYLKKADESASASHSETGHDLQLVTEHNTKKLTGPHAGFAVQHEPGFTDRKPGSPDGGAPASGGDAPPAPPEQTHAAGDFEAQLHDAAKDQSAKDQDTAADSADQMEKVKKVTAEALVAVRQQLPYFAQLQQSSPDAYQAVIGLAQAVALLGKQVLNGGPSPAEALEKGEMASSPPAGGEMGMSEKSVESSQNDVEDVDLEKHPEMQMKKDDHVVQKRPNVPVGAIHDGAMKVRHGDGKTSWKQMQSGMVAGQDAAPPLIAANTHPVSSREPSSK